MGNLVNAGKTSDIPEGEMKLVEIGEERILLSNIEGNFYAIGDTCSHAEASLSDGYIEGEEITNMLIHLTDPAQNDHVRDRYFHGIDLDLSKAFFVFS